MKTGPTQDRTFGEIVCMLLQPDANTFDQRNRRTLAWNDWPFEPALSAGRWEVNMSGRDAEDRDFPL